MNCLKVLWEKNNILQYRIFIPFFILVNFNNVTHCCCCSSVKKVPNKKLLEEEKLRKAAEFKNKIFYTYKSDNRNWMLFNSDSMKIINKGDSQYDVNYNLIKDIDICKTAIKTSIVIPTGDISLDTWGGNFPRFTFNKSKGIVDIVNEGDAVTFYINDDTTILYVYHKNITSKLLGSVGNYFNFHYEGYVLDVSKINYLTNLKFDKDTYSVIKVKFISDDLIQVMFYAEK